MMAGLDSYFDPARDDTPAAERSERVALGIAYGVVDHLPEPPTPQEKARLEAERLEAAERLASVLHLADRIAPPRPPVDPNPPQYVERDDQDLRRIEEQKRRAHQARETGRL